MTRDNFKEVIGGDKHVILELYTPWCRFCKFMKDEYEKLVHFYNLQEDKFPEVRVERSKLGYKKSDIVRPNVIIARLNANTYDFVS